MSALDTASVGQVRPAGGPADAGPAPMPGTDPGRAAARPEDALAVRPLWRMLMARKQFAVCLAILAVLTIAVILAPVLAPDNPLEQDLLSILQGPSAAHWLGTDDLGRDVLSRMLFGGRQTLLGVVQAVAVFVAVGVSLGLIAGMSDGWADTLVTRLGEILLSVPAFIILLVMLSIVPGNMTVAMVSLGVMTSPLVTRVVRGTTKSVRGELFIRGARTMGLTEGQITMRHVLPRLAGPIIVQVTIFCGTAIMSETGLGYLGFGTALPAPSWGNMVTTASQNIGRSPWLLVPTGGIIILTVMTFMLMGDAIRDVVAQRWTGAPSAPARRRRARGTRPGGSPSSMRGSGLGGEEGSDSEASGTGLGSAAGAPLMEVEGLTIVVDQPSGPLTLVHGISFALGRGESLCLVGESGSGKSVTSLALLGLGRGTRVAAGRITVDGEEMDAGEPSQMRRLRTRVFGYITQDPQPSLDPSMRVGDLLAQLVRLHQGVDRKTSRRLALDLLERVQIPEPAAVARRYPHQLSGGMAQRVVIAAALSARPTILIADEPTTALDVTVQAEILALLHELCDDDDSMSLLLVTHDWGVVADIADRVLVMRDGVLVEGGPADRIFHAPAHPHTQAMIAADPARLDVHPERPAGAPLLEVRGLVIEYPGTDAAGRAIRTTAVRGVDLSIAQGRTLGLIGESGSGKSSVGNAIVGLVEAASGSIALEGEELVGASSARRRALSRKVQIIFQDPYGSLNPVRTIGSMLAEPLILAHGMGREAAQAKVLDALERVGLPASSAAKYPAQFSGGQRQRIAIARALVVGPELIVCDEPVSALDLTIQAQVLALLADLQDELGIAYLFISHDLSVVRSFCDDIAVMYRGEIVERGAAGEVILHPQHPYTQSLLAAAPIPDPALQRGRSTTIRRYVA